MNWLCLRHLSWKPKWLRAPFRSFQSNKVRKDRIKSCQCGEAGVAWGHRWWHWGWFPSRTFSWWLMAAVTYRSKFRSPSSSGCPSWWRWTSSSESSFLLYGGPHWWPHLCPKGTWVSRLHLETQNQSAGSVWFGFIFTNVFSSVTVEMKLKSWITICLVCGGWRGFGFFPFYPVLLSDSMKEWSKGGYQENFLN